MMLGLQNSWRTRRLGDLLSYEQPGRYLVRSTNYARNGRYPVLTAGKTFVLGYTNETDGVYTHHPVIIFDDFTTASKYVDFDFKVKSSAMKMLTARPGEADLRFIYERMQFIRFPSLDHKRRWISEFSKLEVDVPSIDEQVYIGKVAEHLSTYIASLERLITKKQAIKQGMMQELLTGKTRLPGFIGNRNWVPGTFEQLASPVKDRTLPAQVSPDTPLVELDQIESATGRLLARSTVTSATSLKTRFQVGDVLFGKLRAYLRKFWIADTSGLCTTEIWAFRSKPGVSAEFVRFIVETDGFIEIASGAYGTHMPRSDWGTVRRYEIAIPEPEEQIAIASVLMDADREIEVSRTRLAKARDIKQGMMQELLTGRTRLPVQEVVA